MIAEIFESMGSAVTGFISTLGNSVNGITSLFYTTGENGGLTFLGSLLVIAAGVGLVYWAFNLIRGLISRA